MRKITLFLFLLLLPSFAQAEPEIKGTPDELTTYISSLPREVTLTGEAKLEIPSESGVVTIGIKTEDLQLKSSLLKNQSIRNEIITKLKNSGIKEDKIKGTTFSSTPEYGLFGKKPNNYVVENILKITIDKEKELQDVAGIVDTHKEVFYQGISLKEKDKAYIKSQLLNMAVSNARARQKVYETELGITLKPISFQEELSMEKIQVGRMDKGLASYKSMSESSAYREEMSLGEHIYNGRVIIKYRVVSK